MIVVTILYPAGGRFDQDYYLATHMPLARSRWEGLLSGTRVLKGVSMAGGGAPTYAAICELSFPSMAELQQAMGGPHAAEVHADVANFTDVTAVIQINEVLE